MAIATKVPFVDLRAQYAQIREEIDASLRRVFEHTAFVQGAEVERFEQGLASAVGTVYSIGVANGTDALFLTLRALGLEAGEEVVLPANTFVATAEAVVHAGARPVLADINPKTYNIDVQELERRVTPRTKVLIPVHLYGQPADMGPILAIAEARGLRVIEDAAQACGAEYNGRKVGSLGAASCFSFYPTKNLGAYGDAGAVATNDEHLARTVRQLSDHGSLAKYDHDVVGYNSRLDTLQAAVLLVKLDHLDEWNNKRRDIARVYDELLRDIPGVVTPAVISYAKHVYHLYVIRVERGSRDGLREYLRGHGVQTGVHYPTPIHRSTAFRFCQDDQSRFPNAEACAQTIVSLPMYPELERGQIEYVAERIRHYMTTCV